MRPLFKAALLGGAALYGVAAFAQTSDKTQPVGTDEASEQGDIVVTAQRREQSVQDVPIAITAVGNKQLETRGVTEAWGLEKIVPNLKVNSGFGNAQPNFTLRGIGVANAYDINQASPVGVYMDDVYLANRSSHGQGLYDLERVEVLRGPQGTLFGRNTTGGAINMITRAPSLRGAQDFAEVGYGDHNTVRAQAAVEATLVEDQLGIRFAGNLVKGDGLFKNVSPGAKDAGAQNLLQGRISIRARPGDGDVEFRLRGYAGRSRDSQVPVTGGPSANPGLGFFEINENRAGDFDTDTYGIALNSKWNINDKIALTSITSYDGGKQRLEHGADGSPIDSLFVLRRGYFKQWSQEVRVNYQTHDLTLIGGFYRGQDTVRVNNDYLLGGALFGLPFSLGFDNHRFRQIRDSTAVFAQGDIAFTDRLTLTLGARYTWDKARFRDGVAFQFLLPGLSFDGPRTRVAQSVYDPADPTQTRPLSLDDANKALTGRVALAYKLEDGTLLYASYNRGYRAGTYNGGSYSTPLGVNFIDPEKVNAYEVGAKGKIGSLTYSLAGFYYDYTGQQLVNVEPGPVSLLANAPSSRIFGAELEIFARVSAWLNINASVGYVNTKYKDLTLQGVVLNGNKLPFAPELTAQVSADIRLFDTNKHKLTFSPSVNYVSSQWFTPFNGVNGVPGQINSELKQKGYAKVDMTLSYERGPMTLRAFVRNVFEEKTYQYGLDLRGSGFSYNYLAQDLPRTYGASIRYTF